MGNVGVRVEQNMFLVDLPVVFITHNPEHTSEIVSNKRSKRELLQLSYKWHFTSTDELPLQVTISLIVKDYLTNIDAMRELYFSKNTDEASLARYNQLLNKYSTPMILLDLKLLRVWPAAHCIVAYNVQHAVKPHICI
jgi:hypothetical protein